jgi:hypothetical protein
MNLTFDDERNGSGLSPELKQLKIKSLIIASMILFDCEIQKELTAGRNIRIKREEQNTASALLRIMGRCKWERN